MRFNNWLARKITGLVGTMWCAYAFAALTLTSLPAALKTHDTVTIISWISQSFLQLVLLSVIMVGQKLADDKRADVQESIRAIHHHLGIKRK